MTKKLQCIKSLKTKLNQMQKDLQRLESTPSQSLQLNYQSHNPTFSRTIAFGSIKENKLLTKSPSWKNPTFWGTNPIVGKENILRSPTPRKNQTSPHLSKNNLTSSMEELKKFADRTFYNPSIKQDFKTPKKGREEKTASQKFQFSFHGQQRETARFQKIKTYSRPPSDPILNPERPQQKGKKIVNATPLSPNLNFFENPKSNPKLYFFGQRMAVLSPKDSNQKNVSPMMRDLLSTSIQSKNMSPKKSSKKHFARYFAENLMAKWD